MNPVQYTTDVSEHSAKPILTDTADEELAQRAQGGCLASFEELVRRYQVPLLRFLRKRCVRLHDAEDILQESFLKAYRALHLYDMRRSFRTWLYTLACRQAISHGRKVYPKSADKPLLTLSDVADAPWQQIEQEETDRDIWATAKRVLTDEQFTAVFLQYVEEMPTVQIAQVLGRSWVSTKTLLHRARRKLLPHLDASGVAFSAGNVSSQSVVRGAV